MTNSAYSRDYPFERQHSPQLKVKLSTLADEGVRIRRIEKKLAKAKNRKPSLAADFESLHYHRVNVVRRVARSTHLAYGFIRGLPYKAMERTCRTIPDAKAIAKMIRDYGGPIEDDRLTAWFAGDNRV